MATFFNGEKLADVKLFELTSLTVGDVYTVPVGKWAKINFQIIKIDDAALKLRLIATNGSTTLGEISGIIDDSFFFTGGGTDRDKIMFAGQKIKLVGNSSTGILAFVVREYIDPIV